MNIDRKRFLLLVTTISASAAAVLVAASGCTITTNNTVADGSAPLADGAIAPDPGVDSGDPNAVDSGSGACLSDKTPGPSCEGLDGGVPAKCVTDCTRYAGIYKSEIAENVRECMDDASTCTGTGAACVEAALNLGCDDPTATAFCTTALACLGTGGIDGGFDAGWGPSDPQAACVNLVRSMNPSERDDLTNCLNNFGGACGPNVLSDCINGTVTNNP